MKFYSICAFLALFFGLVSALPALPTLTSSHESSSPDHSSAGDTSSAGDASSGSSSAGGSPSDSSASGSSSRYKSAPDGSPQDHSSSDDTGAYGAIPSPVPSKSADPSFSSTAQEHCVFGPWITVHSQDLTSYLIGFKGAPLHTRARFLDYTKKHCHPSHIVTPTPRKYADESTSMGSAADKDPDSAMEVYVTPSKGATECIDNALKFALGSKGKPAVCESRSGGSGKAGK